MVKVPKNWERRLVELAAIHGVTDFLLQGRLTKAESKVFYTILNKLGKPAARAGGASIGRLGMTALGVGKQIALRHPVLTAGAIVYYTYKNKDEIADFVEQGYEVASAQGRRSLSGLREALDPETYREGARELLSQPEVQRGPFGLPRRKSPEQQLIEKLRGKKRPSAFNKAVSKGMKAIKNSTSYGKKGTISPANKAFTLVTKLASAKKKKKKAPKSGIRRKIWNAMKGLR